MELNEEFGKEMMMRMNEISTMVILQVQTSVRKSHLILIDVFLTSNVVLCGRRTNGSTLIIIAEAGGFLSVFISCCILLCFVYNSARHASALMFMLQQF
jgi:hypothetical protein